MVKMSLPSSKNQTSSCSTEFNNLKQDLSTIRDAVNKVQELDIDGKAAQQAKAYASKVAGPFISKVNDLLDTMENDIKKLPNKYESMVDNKSWSSDELEEKINSCNKEIMMADLTIAGVSAFMATPGQNDNDMKKCLNSAEKSKENAKSKKAKYEKILEHLKQFDVDSVTIFNNVKDINVAVKQGAGVFSKPFPCFLYFSESSMPPPMLPIKSPNFSIGLSSSTFTFLKESLGHLVFSHFNSLADGIL